VGGIPRGSRAATSRVLGEEDEAVRTLDARQRLRRAPAPRESAFVMREEPLRAPSVSLVVPRKSNPLAMSCAQLVGLNEGCPVVVEIRGPQWPFSAWFNTTNRMRALRIPHS